MSDWADIRDHQFGVGEPVTAQEADWMISSLEEDLRCTDPGDPRSESVGHALHLWTTVRRDLDQGNLVSERPTGTPDTI